MKALFLHPPISSRCISQPQIHLLAISIYTTQSFLLHFLRLPVARFCKLGTNCAFLAMVIYNLGGKYVCKAALLLNFPAQMLLYILHNDSLNLYVWMRFRLLRWTPWRLLMLVNYPAELTLLYQPEITVEVTDKNPNPLEIPSRFQVLASDPTQIRRRSIIQRCCGCCC